MTLPDGSTFTHRTWIYSRGQKISESLNLASCPDKPPSGGHSFWPLVSAASFIWSQLNVMEYGL